MHDDPELERAGQSRMKFWVDGHDPRAVVSLYGGPLDCHGWTETSTSGRTLFEEVAYEVDRRGLMSDDHFSVDCTLIEAAVSIKSFRRRNDDDDTDDSGNGAVHTEDFPG